ncbi:MAG: hypothetical protein JO028_02895 [Acidobacteriaceae bacterium]|nr:hypothetical protein [Acidobacteriaceae bacterium]
MRQWKEIQTMLRSQQLTLLLLVSISPLWSQNDSALWKEYGFVNDQTARAGKLNVHSYQFRDLTGALAAWESMRSPNAQPCDLAPICSRTGNDLLISTGNYVLRLTGPAPTKAEVEAVINTLPDRRETSLPAILTFLPQEGLVPNSTRYILGPESLKAFAPELNETIPGFDQGAEAQVAAYKLAKEGPAHLALFYYPTPEMARLHATDFKVHAGQHVKRSGVLVAVIYGPVTDDTADTLLSRVSYEAKITWNETPPPSPIKPLYQLLLNILYLSVILSCLCITAGLIYAGMRIYRRRYGSLESEESMTVLNLSGD